MWVENVGEGGCTLRESLFILNLHQLETNKLRVLIDFRHNFQIINT